MSRKFEPVQDIISPYAKSKLNNDFKYLFENLNAQGKSIQDLVAEGQLTVEQYGHLIYIINGLVKSGEIQKSDLSPGFESELNYLNTQLQKKVGGDRKLKPEDFSDEAMALVTGNGTINLLSIPQAESVDMKTIAPELIQPFDGAKYEKTVNTNANTLDMAIVFEPGINLTGKEISFYFEGYVNDANITGVSPEIYLSTHQNSLADFIRIEYATMDLEHHDYFKYSDTKTSNGTKSFVHFFPYPQVSNRNLKPSIFMKGFYMEVNGIRYYPKSERWHKEGSDQLIEPVESLPLRLATYTDLTDVAKIEPTYSKWHGSDLVMLGDSIVWYDGNGRKGYLSWLDEIIGFNSTLNVGVSGANITDDPQRSGDVVDQVTKVDYTAYDLVIIAAGTNDFKNGMPIGSLNEMYNTQFDTATFYGAYRHIIEYILTRNQEANIRLFTPLQRNAQAHNVDTINAAGHKLIDYVDAVIKVGEMYGIPVCDLYRTSGVNKLNLLSYTNDGLHLVDLGYEQVTKKTIAPFLETF